MEYRRMGRTGLKVSEYGFGRGQHVLGEGYR